VIALLLPLWGCGRTIEDDEPPELVEHRIEPCRQWCTPYMSPQCGARPEDYSFRSVDECVEDCAAAEPDGGWEWALQADGTDACADEWFIVAECVDALTCEEQRDLFMTIPAIDHEWPCKSELDARAACFYSTPSLDRIED